MAQFYGDLNHGSVTRTGSKANGLTGHIRGWHTGARVEMSHENGVDVCRVYRTTGSNGQHTVTLVAEWTENDRPGEVR